MTARAIIVAIEVYPKASSIGAQLPGTIDAAHSFLGWLEETKKVSRQNILFFSEPSSEATVASGGAFAAGSGNARRQTIVDGISNLLPTWQDTTEELYVFWSGHGFAWSYAPGRAPLDILVCSDFVATNDGNAYIELAELQERIAAAMGPGDHYWFLDVCRNVLTTEETEPGGLRRTWNWSRLGASQCRFTMFPVVSRNTARVNSDYARALCEGLRGRGRAKGWNDDGSMSVTFERLFRAMKPRLGDGELDRQVLGACDGTILPLAAPYEVACDVVVEGAAPGDSFQLALRTLGPLSATKTISLSGPRTRLRVPVADYEVELSSDRGVHMRHSSLGSRVELFDDGEVLFSELARHESAEKRRNEPYEPDSPPSPAPDRSLLLSLGGALRMMDSSEENAEARALVPREVASAGPRATLVLAALPIGVAFRVMWLGDAGGISVAQRAPTSGIWWAALAPTEVERLLFWQIGDQRPRATPILTMPGRTSLIVIDAQDNATSARMFKYVIPRTPESIRSFSPSSALVPWLRFLWSVQRRLVDGRAPTKMDFDAEATFRSWLDTNAEAEPMTRLAHHFAMARAGCSSLADVIQQPHASHLREALTLAEVPPIVSDPRLARLDTGVAWTTWTLKRDPKIPPVDAMAKSEEMAFVGANHRNLPTALSRAFEARSRRAWERIEIYFLQEERLEWLVFVGGPSHVKLREERRDAERELRALLSDRRVAKSWAIYEYDRPLLFASYWDWTKQDGWVHVSPHVWGADISTCPSVDYFRSSPGFQTYVEGLGALRAMATLMATSSPPHTAAANA